MLICKTSVYKSIPVGGQTGRSGAGAGVLCLQSVFLLLGPLEPVILWTRAQAKDEKKRGGVESLVPDVRSLCTRKESEAPAPNSAHAQSGRLQTSVETSVIHLRWFLPQLLIWAEATCHSVVCLSKSLCVWLETD